MTVWDYAGFWIVMGVVFVVVHAALTSAPGSLMARGLAALARYFGWMG